MKTRVIIAGSRGLRVDVARIKAEVFAFLDRTYEDYDAEDIEVVSGGEPTGVDACGELFSEQVFGKPARRFPAEWGRHGKAAGPIRNEQMADYATAAVVFVKGGPTPGSSNMATWMLVLGKPVCVVSL